MLARSIFRWPAMSLVLLVGSTARLEAARPEAAKLLPAETVVFVSVPDSRLLAERFLETNLGRMTQDEELAPLVGRLYDEVKAAFGPVEEQLGLSLDDLLAIPQGELTFALVAPEEGRPTPVLLLDVHEQILAVEELFENAERALRQNGGDIQRETIAGEGPEMKTYEQEIHSYRLPRTENRRIIRFEKDGTLVLAAERPLAETILAHWNGKSGDTLAGAPDYAAIMRRTQGAVGEEPQLTWYVDPMRLIGAATQGNNTAGFFLTLLGPLGLNGFEGVGGSLTFAAEEFDAIFRMQVLLENPRVGLLDAIVLETGDITPEDWVPPESASYTTLHFDVGQSYGRLANLLDGFQGEGATKRFVGQAFDRLELSFEDELVPALDNRFSYVTWIEEPVTPTSQSQLLGVRLTDGKKFAQIFEKAIGSFDDRVETESYLGRKYYQFRLPERRRQRPGEEAAEDEPRDDAPRPPRPRPCVALLGNYVLVADRPSVLQRAIACSRDPELSLAHSLDFKLIAAKAQRQAGEGKLSLLSFNRPEEGLRFMHDLATTDANRQRLRQRAENSRFFRTLNDGLEDHPLPSFDRLRAYLAPGGAVLIDDDAGLRYVSFSLRRGQPKE